MKYKRPSTSRSHLKRNNPNIKTAARTATLSGPPPLNLASPEIAPGRLTREALIKAAIDVIGEKGFAAARVQTIVRRAGVGYGTFYNYFSSKMDLIEEVLTQIYGEIHDSWYRVPRRRLEPIERIRLALEQALEIHQRYRSILVILSEAVNLSRNLIQLRDAQLERDVRDLEKIIGVYREEGYESPGDPYLLALALCCMTDEVIRRWLIGDAVISREALIETIVSVYESVLLRHTGHTSASVELRDGRFPSRAGESDGGRAVRQH